MLVMAILAYREAGFGWGMFLLLFFAPDLLMLGYVLGRKTGASIYNAGHTYVAPFLMWVVVYFAHAPSLFPFVAIWFGHIGFDRLLGYGLKYETGFKDTHLGKV